MAPTPGSPSDGKKRSWTNRSLSRPAVITVLVTGLLAAVVARYSIKRLFFADVRVVEETQQKSGRRTGKIQCIYTRVIAF